MARVIAIEGGGAIDMFEIGLRACQGGRLHILIHCMACLLYGVHVTPLCGCVDMVKILISGRSMERERKIDIADTEYDHTYTACVMRAAGSDFPFYTVVKSRAKNGHREGKHKVAMCSSNQILSSTLKAIKTSANDR